MLNRAATRGSRSDTDFLSDLDPAVLLCLLIISHKLAQAVLFKKKKVLPFSSWLCFAGYAAPTLSGGTAMFGPDLLVSIYSVQITK